MRSRLAVLVLFVLGPGLSVLSGQDAPAVQVEKPKSVIIVKPPEMVTIYLHYYFPNYSHGYYIGWTMTVECQVPVGEAKAYLSGQGGGAPTAEGAANVWASSTPNPWASAAPR